MVLRHVAIRLRAGNSYPLVRTRTKVQYPDALLAR